MCNDVINLSSSHTFSRNYILQFMVISWTKLGKRADILYRLAYMVL